MNKRGVRNLVAEVHHIPDSDLYFASVSSTFSQKLDSTYSKSIFHLHENEHASTTSTCGISEIPQDRSKRLITPSDFHL